MNVSALEPRLAVELRALLDQELASGALMSPARMDQHFTAFRDRFGPAMLGTMRKCVVPATA